MIETRILREVGALMTLKHPGVVGVHGYDRWPDPVTCALYLVMDFVDGLPLMKWADQDECSLRKLVEVFRLLALAIHEMHQMGVVHRDIKSSNVLVVSTGPLEPAPFATRKIYQRAPGANRTYQPVLVDFGLARPERTPNVTAEFVLVGTDGHWAPELLANPGAHFDYTPATDLFALGHLFYEALTGCPPFRADKNGSLSPPSSTSSRQRPAA